MMTTAVSLALAASALGARPAEAQSTVNVLPAGYTTTAGGDGGQPVANMHVRDQSGTQDNWNKYVEFTTPGSAYTGYRSYSLPATIAPSAVSGLQVQANYRGPAKAQQTWTWRLYDWSTASWVVLGNNTGASSWRWSYLTFTASGDLTRFINASTREVRVGWVSNNAVDNAQIDYEVLLVSILNGSATATPTPTRTVAPPTATSVSPTATSVSPTATSVPPTATPTQVPAGPCTRFVAPTGANTNAGTQAAPWKTIQHAAQNAQPGDVVCVRAGVYNEVVTFAVSGSAAAPITFQSFPGETAVVDGTGKAVPAGETGLFMITTQSYLVIKGFELRNYKTATSGRVPVGIRIYGTAHHIELRNNVIHHIEHNGTARNGTDAHGIAVHGTSGTQPVNAIIINGNELYALKLGSSEALVLNGNVDGWQVTNNTVRDSNNIGIDAIGFEGTAPTNDQARNGLIAGNHVYNIDTFGNPAYGTDRSAGCIYVDGGADIVIERNRVHHCNLGIEIASEHAGRATSRVTVRNNFIYANTEVGIAMGGYDAQRGSTENCVIVNNTLVGNNTSNGYGAELYIQYDTRNNVIKNNIIVAGSAGWFIKSWSTVMQGNAVDANLYYTTAAPQWQWRNVTYSGATAWASYRSASGNDAASLNGQDPLLVNPAAGDLHLQAGSPAIGRGQALPEASAVDIDGQPRVQGVIDLGADEVP
jgi:hypothetical protein